MSRGGRPGQDPPARLLGLGGGGGGCSEAGRETSGMRRRSADTYILLPPGSQLVGTAGQGRGWGVGGMQIPGGGGDTACRGPGLAGVGSLAMDPRLPTRHGGL